MQYQLIQIFEGTQIVKVKRTCLIEAQSQAEALKLLHKRGNDFDAHEQEIIDTGDIDFDVLIEKKLFTADGEEILIGE